MNQRREENGGGGRAWKDCPFAAMYLSFVLPCTGQLIELVFSNEGDHHGPNI